MSYWARVNFKSIHPNEVVPFLKKISTESKNRLEDIANETYSWCSLTDDIGIFEESQIPKYREVSSRIERWARTVFTFKYYYNESMKVLAVIGTPQALNNLFDSTVEFQSNTDQDYGRETWMGIDPFVRIFDKWQEATQEEILSANDYLDREVIDGDEEATNYWKRASAYQEIWEQFSGMIDDDNMVLYQCVFGYNYESAFNQFCVMVYQKKATAEKKTIRALRK